MATTRPTVLIVDDALPNLDILVGLLKHDYRVKPATSGERALQIAGSGAPPDLVLLDIMMPGMGGLEVCRRLADDKRLCNVPIIFISALDGVQNKVAAFDGGGVDYITKPFQPQEVLARVRTQIELARLRSELQGLNLELADRVREQVEEIATSQCAMILALTKLAESRDDNTGQHLERVRAYCQLIGQQLQELALPDYALTESSVRTIVEASCVHDIGKVAIRDEILLKPGKLTAEEFEVMKRHTLAGAQTLMIVHQQYPKNDLAFVGQQIARSHHERWDGTGYPDGLREHEIPLSARIVALADVYDALRSDRPYKRSYSHEQSRDIIVEGRGTHLDPVIVDSFISQQESFRAVSESVFPQWASCMRDA